MTKQQAQEQSQVFRDFGKDLDRSLRDLMAGGATGAQFSEYREIVGKLLGYAYFAVLQPVWSRYPDIEPEEMRDRQGVPPSPPLSVEQCKSILELMTRFEGALGNYYQAIDDAGDAYYLEAADVHRQDFSKAISTAREFVQDSHPELLDGLSDD